MSADNSGYETKYALIKLNSNELPLCRCVYYRPSTNELYAGTDDGVWKSSYTGQVGKFYKVSSSEGGFKATSFFKLSADNVNVFTYNDMLAATDRGLLSVGKGNGLTRFAEYYEFPHTESMSQVADRVAFIKDDGFCTVEDGCLPVDPSGPAAAVSNGVLVPAGRDMVSAYFKDGSVGLTRMQVDGIESDILQVVPFKSGARDALYLRTAQGVYSYDARSGKATAAAPAVDEICTDGNMVYARTGGSLSAMRVGNSRQDEYPAVEGVRPLPEYAGKGVTRVVVGDGEYAFVAKNQLCAFSQGSPVDKPCLAFSGAEIADVQKLPANSTANGYEWSYAAAVISSGNRCVVRLYGDFDSGTYADSQPVQMAGAIERPVAAGMANGMLYLVTNFNFYYQDVDEYRLGEFKRAPVSFPTATGAGSDGLNALVYSDGADTVYRIGHSERVEYVNAGSRAFWDSDSCPSALAPFTGGSGRRIAPAQFVQGVASGV